MPSNSFLNGTAGRPMIFAGFSGASINLISSHNSLGDSFDSWKIPEPILSHAYEENALKLYVYLFLGLVLSRKSKFHSPRNGGSS